ncbi:TPA: hypothetical protein L7572_003629 [Klebsiella variicola]|nr:hypothetical protein [Klebsiella variicola]
MKIGVVVLDEYVGCCNNLIYHIARQLTDDVIIFDGGINGLIGNRIKQFSIADLLDYSLSNVPIITVGEIPTKMQSSTFRKIKTTIQNQNIDILILISSHLSRPVVSDISNNGIKCYILETTNRGLHSETNEFKYVSGASKFILSEVRKVRNAGRHAPGQILWVSVVEFIDVNVISQIEFTSNADIVIVPEFNKKDMEIVNQINAKLQIQNSIVIISPQPYNTRISNNLDKDIRFLIKKVENITNKKVIRLIIDACIYESESEGKNIIREILMVEELTRCIDAGLQNKMIVMNNGNAFPVDINQYC